MSYNPNNIFAKILRGEIPNKTVFENEYALAFHDITPKAAIHVLVIPKGEYIDMVDFGARATSDEMTGFYRAVSEVTKILELNNTGCRMIANTGLNGGQEVPHFHIHIVGGEKLGAMIGK